MERIICKKMLTARVPEELINELNRIAEVNQRNRTDEIERYIREGIERSKRVVKFRYVFVAIMYFVVASYFACMM
jgi:metal-responsive CopG/Arc/MetJ family transcriptional regulator